MVIEVELVTENQRNQQSPARQDGGLTVSSGMPTGLSRKGLTVGGEPPRETKENRVPGIPWRPGFSDQDSGDEAWGTRQKSQVGRVGREKRQRG